MLPLCLIPWPCHVSESLMNQLNTLIWQQMTASDRCLGLQLGELAPCKADVGRRGRQWDRGMRSPPPPSSSKPVSEIQQKTSQHQLLLLLRTLELIKQTLATGRLFCCPRGPNVLLTHCKGISWHWSHWRYAGEEFGWEKDETLSLSS